MRNPVRLDAVLSDAASDRAEQLALFALLNLGIIESLGSGLMSANDALALFYLHDNCRFVRKRLRDNLADQIMSRGVQLPDLFEALLPDEAHREFQHELEIMRSHCRKLLEAERVAA